MAQRSRISIRFEDLVCAAERKGVLRAMVCNVLENGTLAKDHLELVDRSKRARLSDDDKAHLQRGLLVWALSGSPAARIQWAVLATSSRDGDALDRDTFVRTLWTKILEDDAFKPVRDQLEDRGWLDSYRTIVSQWFVRRFAVVDALRVGARFDHPLRWLIGSALAVVLFSLVILGASGPSPLTALLALVGPVLVLVALAWATKGNDRWSALAALVPRLGAAVGIGYLFLAAAQELSLVLMRPDPHFPPCLRWIIVSCLLLATWFYILLHMARHLEPNPPLRVLACRSALLLTLAVAWTSLGLALAAPLLYSDLYHHPNPQPDATFASMALLGAVALALGVVLELAWEDRPLTEPL